MEEFCFYKFWLCLSYVLAETILSRKMLSIIFFEADTSVAANSKGRDDYHKTCQHLMTDERSKWETNYFSSNNMHITQQSHKLNIKDISLSLCLHLKLLLLLHAWFYPMGFICFLHFTYMHWLTKKFQKRLANWIYITNRPFPSSLWPQFQGESTSRGGGGTAIYGLYRYVPLWRVWFSSSLLWRRVYKSERLGLE